jgi:hypothetical protein
MLAGSLAFFPARPDCPAYLFRPMPCSPACSRSVVRTQPQSWVRGTPPALADDCLTPLGLRSRKFGDLPGPHRRIGQGDGQ